MDYAGVDVIRDSEGRNLVIEVNSIPSWKGLQGVCPINIAECLVDDFLTRRLARPRLDIVT
jgi:glutathione synthase/RimK-type ligase-like ATP-grasp enzyme